MTRDQLKIKAMLALEDIVMQARENPFEDFRSMQLRFILAWLFSQGRGCRSVYDRFWYEATRTAEGFENYQLRVDLLNQAIDSVYFDQRMERTKRLQLFQLHKQQIKQAKMN
jgi:hypothetical protein